MYCSKHVENGLCFTFQALYTRIRKKPFEAAATTADTLGGGGITDYTHTTAVRSSTSIKQALMAWMEVLTSASPMSTSKTDNSKNKSMTFGPGRVKCVRKSM